jgi:F-type H+-transporting ATPase subunit delta
MSTSISSKRYAQAVFQIARDRNELDKWKSDLKRIAEIMHNQEFTNVVRNPKVPFQFKADLTQKSLGKTSQLALNFAYLLIFKNKSNLAGQIVDDYEQELDNYYGIKRAEAVSAIPLNDIDKAKLNKRLENILESKVKIDFSVDPEILGGFIAKVDGKIIDGSIRNQLEILKQNMAGIIK